VVDLFTPTRTKATPLKTTKDFFLLDQLCGLSLSLGAKAITSLRLRKLECDVEFRRGEFSSSNSNWKVMLLQLLFSWLRWFLLGPHARCHRLPSVTSCQRRIDQRTHTQSVNGFQTKGCGPRKDGGSPQTDSRIQLDRVPACTVLLQTAYRVG
jgi:hypothetical protein